MTILLETVPEAGNSKYSVVNVMDSVLSGRMKIKEEASLECLYV